MVKLDLFHRCQNRLINGRNPIKNVKDLCHETLKTNQNKSNNNKKIMRKTLDNGKTSHGLKEFYENNSLMRGSLQIHRNTDKNSSGFPQK